MKKAYSFHEKGIEYVNEPFWSVSAMKFWVSGFFLLAAGK